MIFELHWQVQHNLAFSLFFRQLDGEPLKIIQEKLENELHIFYNYFVILYADDTVILSETKENIEKRKGNKLSPCRTPVRQGKKFRLTTIILNTRLNKVMIFRKRKTAQDPKFILHGQALDIVDTYSYLGILFKYNGTFLRLGKNL
jgi:hypothetical protein